jgi:hypothetical protein
VIARNLDGFDRAAAAVARLGDRCSNPANAPQPADSAARAIALITEVCCRMNRWRVRWSISPLCCSGVLIGTNRILVLVTASQMASASAASFFCRLT